MHPLVHDVVRDLVAFLFERLDHNASVNQIFQGKLAQFNHFFFQFLSGELLPQQFLPRGGQRAHLRVGDDVAVYNCGDAIHDLGFLSSRSATNRAYCKHEAGQHCDAKLMDHVPHNFLISSTISPRRCSVFVATKRGNLPATSIKSPCRVNITLRSRTSTRLTPDSAAASLISTSANKLSTAGGNAPKRSRQSRSSRSSCSRDEISAISRYERMRMAGSLTYATGMNAGMRSGRGAFPTPRASGAEKPLGFVGGAMNSASFVSTKSRRT